MNQVIQLNEEYSIRAEMLDGIKYLVVPVVMMVEGVHSGSHGPLLHTTQELGRFPESWDGIPIIVSHPQIDGVNVSANRPDVIESTVGRVFNTHMEGDKLKAEAWLNEQKLIATGSNILEYIRSKKPLDVSVGVFTEEEETVGVWNNENYTAIARNLRPDHLALLPGEQGACSWSDGCGIRLNKKGGKSVKQHGLYQVFLTNQTDYTELQRKIQDKLDGLDSGSTYHYLAALYDNEVIYEVRDREETKFYKRSYSVDQDGSVTFAEEKTPVTRKVEYISATNSEGTPKIVRTKVSNNKKKEESSMSNEATPCCPEKVNALIANARSKFAEEDKDWLLTLSAEQLTKLEVPEEKKGEKKEEKVEPQLTANAAKEVLKNALKSEEDFIALMPETMQDQMRSGMALHQAQRDAMVAEIVSNSKDVWSEDELKAMNTEMLTKVAKSVSKQVNYAPMGSGIKNEPEVYQEEPMIPVEYETEEK